MILHRSDQAATIRALRNAAPYIRLYKGKVFVIKAGGAVFGDAALTRALIEQIAILHGHFPTSHSASRLYIQLHSGTDNATPIADRD